MPAPGADAHAAALMRSLLFVPADGGRKLDKALRSGADAIIIDLEDSIAPDRKAQARAGAAGFIKEAVRVTARPRILVRVNGLATGLTDADLDAVVPAAPDAIVLPKAEGGAAIVHADAKLCVREAMQGLPEGHVKIVAMAIETAAALFLAGSFRGASARLLGLSWGPEDLAAELGAEANRADDGSYSEPYRLARALCLAAAAAAQVEAIETIYPDYRNDAGLARDSELARRDGFAGRLAIHPAQVPIINEIFTPSAEAVAKARAIVAAFEASPGAGVIGLDGIMYDRPHLARAQQLIARAKPSAREKASGGDGPPPAK
jgi:citrate lyase subunit beta / citryl-CoA lyase